jgi:ADP-heptose:LPS heptosyltransferase
MTMSSTPTNIAVLRLDNLGDHVLGAGLLTALRAAYPAARIVQVAPTALGDLYARCPVLNHLIKVPARAQYVQDPERLAGIVRELAAGEKFDLVINPRYAEDWYFAAPMCRALTAPGGRTVGFRQDSSPVPGYDANQFFTQLFDAPADLHASRYAQLMVWQLGLQQAAEPVVWFAAEDLAYVRQRYALHTEPYVVVGCGASVPHRIPALPQLSHLVRQLTAWWGRRVILVGGPADQALAASIISAVAGERVTSTAGELQLYQLSALLSGAELYVGPDSGPVHVAAATGIPVIELDSWPAGHPSTSRGTWTSGRLWSPWSARTIIVHPDPVGFAARRQSPDYANRPVDDIPLADIDAALEALLGHRLAG